MDAPRKKVFVSGCYDLLHSGHVAFFAEAAKLGDLYVGIGSDRTIAELKHRQTVNPEAERLYMVKAIRYVKDAWINSGSGLMDFTAEVEAAERVPSPGLPARSTTALRGQLGVDR